MKKVLLAIAFVSSAIIGKAQTTVVTIPGSQVQRLTSSSVAGQEYELQISLPSGYEKGNKTYPVVYLMDSQWDFPLLTALYGQQYYDGFLPELVIVGVTWGGTKPNPDSLRARDYTPTKEARAPQSGGADAFLQFLKNEAFPYVEKNYRVSKEDRTLVGCSLGGLFTLYTLFTQPTLFQRYVAASPAFTWDNGVLSTFAKTYAQQKNPPAKLFLCVGGVELSAPAFQTFTGELNRMKPAALQMQSRVLENTGHSGTKGEGYARGLQFVFQKPALTLRAAQLARFAGKYQFSDGQTIEIRPENGSLALIASPTTKMALFAASTSDFYAKSQFLNLHFTTDGVVIDRYGSTVMALRKRDK